MRIKKHKQSTSLKEGRSLQYALCLCLNYLVYGKVHKINELKKYCFDKTYTIPPIG